MVQSPKIGDVVRLRSGGPAMTVEVPISADVLVCCWFHEGRRMNAMFRVEMLEPAAAEQSRKRAVVGAMN
ncbi:MAG: DUF2158 domain-containing protein [Pseudomonadota bacterium]